MVQYSVCKQVRSMHSRGLGSKIGRQQSCRPVQEMAVVLPRLHSSRPEHRCPSMAQILHYWTPHEIPHDDAAPAGPNPASDPHFYAVSLLSKLTC